MARTHTARSTARVGGKPPAPPAVKTPFRTWFDKWVAGGQLAALAVAAGIKRSKFRRLLIAEAGGKAKFAELRTQGAGGAGRGANLRKGATRSRVDDSQLKFLKSGGWGVRRIWVPKLVTIKLPDGKGKVEWRECTAMIFISPKGNEYVRAQAGEPADALIRGQHALPHVRLKRYAGSKQAVKVEASLARAEQHKAAVERVQTQDSARRVARRKARKAGRK